MFVGKVEKASRIDLLSANHFSLNFFNFDFSMVCMIRKKTEVHTICSQSVVRVNIVILIAIVSCLYYVYDSMYSILF